MIADRFELHHQLGRGGMATVWEATDRRLGRRVAIKLMREDASSGFAARMEQEARAAARITDPRVVTVLDLDRTADGMPFLVLELLTGETLADQLRRGPLDGVRLRRLRNDLLGALASAHGAGVLHRDVKPSNVLVDGDGYRVGDFGLASFDDTPAERDHLMGTIAYLAPERLAGAPASARADVFAAGAVLYEAACGAPPFRGPTVAETLADMRSGELTPLEVGRRIGPALADAVHRALAADPDDRPADAGELLELASLDGTSGVDHTVVLDASAPPGGQTARLEAPVRWADTDPTRTVDATSPLRPTGEQPSVPAPSGDRPSPVSGRERPTSRRGGVDLDVLRRPPVLFVGAAVLLLLLAIVAVGSAGQDEPSPDPGLLADDPETIDLDATLDRIDELGR